MLRALILHGFTGTLATVRCLGPVCESRNLPFDMPLLRGHGTRPEDLEGVTWRDWYADAEAVLLKDEGPVVLMGLSMGGLVALDLAGRHPNRVRGLVSVAACLHLRSPLLHLLPILQEIIPYWQSVKEPLRMPESGEVIAYEKFPVRAVGSLLEYSNIMRRRLHAIRCPILVVQSWNDQVVKPYAARHIFDGVSSTDKEIARFEQSEHDMLIGCEWRNVCRRIGDWLDLRLPAWKRARAAETQTPDAH